MGQRHDARMLQEPTIHLGFARENVQTGCSEAAGIERLEKGGLVDQVTACRIDEYGASLHAAEAGGVH